jgi:hypothetical protein
MIVSVVPRRGPADPRTFRSVTQLRVADGEVVMRQEYAGEVEEVVTPADGCEVLVREDET